jgi:hypothetical protein
VRIGRPNDCDLAIEGDLVSRIHARIEHRRGKVVLTDQSTNGTFVMPGDARAVYLRREETPLWGCGRICPGRRNDPLGKAVIYYQAR